MNTDHKKVVVKTLASIVEAVKFAEKNFEKIKESYPPTMGFHAEINENQLLVWNECPTTEVDPKLIDDLK